MSDTPIRVTCTDPVTGDVGHAEVKPGGYLVVCAEPAYVAHEQVHANGTRVVTIKKRSDPMTALTNATATITVDWSDR